MKGSFYGLRAKEIFLITIFLLCATIFVWAWEKTPLLTTFLPRQTQLLLYPDTVTRSTVARSIPSEEEEITGKDAILSAGDDAVSKEEDPFGDPTTINHPSNMEKTHLQNKVNLANVSEHKQILEDKGRDRSISQPIGKNEEQLIEERSKRDPTKDEGEVKQKVVNDSRQGHPSLDSVPSIDPSYNLTVSKKHDENLTKVGGHEVCNYGKGKWVVDDRRPLYSGLGCKQWLSGMWSCRMTQRTDFAYEKLRWEPKDCEMEEFEGSKFLKRMQGKTLAFVGDSLGRQQFQSLMCMVTAGKDQDGVIDVGNEYGLVLAPGDTRPNGWAYQFPTTNTTILYYWSATLNEIEPIDKTKPDTDYAMHLDRPPPFLHQFLHKFDVLVLNTGHHWNRGKLKANRWVMYVNGKPNADKKLAPIWSAKNLTVYSVVKWVDSQLVNYPKLKAFYRTISPRHFVGGDWNTGGSCDNTNPMSVGKEIVEEESSDPTGGGAVKGTKVKLLDITGLSQLRDEGHISRFSMTAKSGVQDCLHWCLPGVPDTWNEILFGQI